MKNNLYNGILLGIAALGTAAIGWCYKRSCDRADKAYEKYLNDKLEIAREVAEKTVENLNNEVN